MFTLMTPVGGGSQTDEPDGGILGIEGSCAER